MIIKRLFICFLVFLFYSCKKNENINDIYIKKFEKKIYLKAEQIIKNDNSAIAIYSIDTLLLAASNGTENHFNIYGKNSFKLLGNLGVKGDNPNSWLFAFYTNQFTKEKDGLYIWLSSPVKGKFMKVNLTKNIKSKSSIPIIEKTIPIDIKKFTFNNLVYVNDSIVFGNSGYFDIERVRLKKYNSFSNQVSESKLFPKTLNNNLFSSDEMNKLYRGQVKKHPTKNLFVSALRFFDRIDIFDEELNKKISILGKGLHKDNELDISKLNNKGGEPFNELYYYNFDFDLTQKYIYVLYYNQLYKDYGQTKPTEIRVFDWNGNSKFLIKIDDYLMNISVDEDNGYIYGVDFFNEKILRYDIKNLTK